MQAQSNSCPLERYWTSPINIGGLDRASVATLFADDLFDLLQPTLATANDPEAAFQLHRKAGLMAYGNLHDVVECRAAALSGFLRQAAMAVDQVRPASESGNPVTFHCLSGDSHNGGKRPLAVNIGKEKWVLKFADPRPYQLLGDVLGELSRGIGTDLVPPKIIADRNHNWCFAPFLESAVEHSHQVESFMFALGALTAVAYCLRMVDLHLENLFVFEGKPIIIDPECILYNFSQEEPQSPLLSTGLLSHNPNLSALRGGDLSKQKIDQIGLYERPDGVLDYRKPALDFHNRLRISDGRLADPSEHRQSLFDGFASAYEWFMGNPDLVTDILIFRVPGDFRIRYLVRKTRLYIATIHMLNLPVSYRYEDWRDSLFARFRHAGHFPERTSEGLVRAELKDMEARDVPYFWVNADELLIRHRSGAKQRLSCLRTARDQAIEDIRSLSRSDLEKQKMVLRDFLDADLIAPVNDI